MTDGIYHCKYGLLPECGEFRKEDVDIQTQGLTDAFIFISILREGSKAHEGASSTMILSFDGQNGGDEIPDTELFSTWAILASRLASSPGCPEWQREIAQQTFTVVREKIMIDRQSLDKQDAL